MAAPKLKTTEELVLYADQLAQAIREAAYLNKIHPADMLIGATMALSILRATYPAPEQLFALMQEAEGMMDLYLRPGEPC